MAYISFKPTDHFNPKKYTGDGSTSHSITGVGFQPDLVWNKPRDTSGWHRVFDSVRGVLNVIYPNDTYNNEVMPSPGGLNAFNSDGFTLGDNTGSNENTKLFITWNWKMGTTSGLSGGTITPASYSINTTAKQGVYKWAGTGSNGTIAHGLGSTPKMFIVKQLNSTAGWQVYHSALGETKVFYLNSDAAPDTSSTVWNDTAPTSTLLSLGTNTGTNASGSDYIGYAFCDVKGYCKIGSYKGNATADLKGPFIYTGFRPAFIMIKILVGTASWYLYDNTRQGYNGDEGATPYLQANSTSVDDTNSGNFGLDIYNTGFKVRGSHTGVSGNNDELSYIAFAEFPMVSSTGQATPGALF